MTKIYNRRYFEEQLKEIVKISAVAMIDIDDFKRINDSYGHQIGDKALCKVAEVLLAHSKDIGYIIRFGGDEFLIVFNEISKKEFSEVLETFRKAVYDARLSEQIKVQLSISIGAVYCESCHENVLAEADQMLYVAKKEKNKVVLKQGCE